MFISKNWAHKTKMLQMIQPVQATNMMMTSDFKLIFLLLLVAPMSFIPTNAFPNYNNYNDKEQRTLAGAATTTLCPLHQNGDALESANGQARLRLTQFENDFPASEHGRRYVIGQANANETYCDGTDEQKYCNKIHGAWGDLIPRNGQYCLWVMLEFQDPPEFNYSGLAQNGSALNDNTTKFGNVALSALNSLAALPNVTDKIVGAALHDGTPIGEMGVIPWPIASIVWKNGNVHAKDWIKNVHRPSVQDVGYGFGFTFRGHYKAIQCDQLEAAFAKHGVSLASNFSNLVLNNGLFKQYWNTFVDMTDLSLPLAVAAAAASQTNNDTSCTTDCVVAPCLDTANLPVAAVPPPPTAPSSPTGTVPSPPTAPSSPTGTTPNTAPSDSSSGVDRLYHLQLGGTLLVAFAGTVVLLLV